MKKILSLLGVVGMSIISFAQESNNTDNYNKWTVEVGGGANKAVSPFSTGSYSNTPGFYNVNAGVRYMINNKFGLKVIGNYDRVKDGDGSNRFKADFYRIGLEGVANLGRVLSFEDWTNTIGLLGHAGGGYGLIRSTATKEITGKSGFFNGSDQVGYLTIGLTPQVKISNRVVLSLDAAYSKTIRQDVSWNGDKLVDKRGFDGDFWNFTAGVSYAFGKNKKHADWVSNTSKKDDLAIRVTEIERMLVDTDGDGVADYLDQEPNSAPGAVVDTRGITIDSTGNGVPDVIETYIQQYIQ
jgi:OmpA-OmpF porin, OOP family